MFYTIPQNVWRHSLECFMTFPGIFGNIPQNVWRHSLEYNIPPIPQVPHFLLPVTVLLFLYIAL